MCKTSIREGISDFFDKQDELFMAHLQLARESFDQEAIHQFRLNLKRIKALFQLTAFCTGDKLDPEALFQPLKKIFKPSGRVRDAQVLTDLVNSYEASCREDFTKISEQFLIIQLKFTPKLKKRMQLFDHETLHDMKANLQSSISHIPDEKLTIRATGWISSRLAYLSDLRKLINDPDIFHRFRAHLKDVFYMIDMLNEYTPINIQIKADIACLKEIARGIGTWHDHYILLNNLHRFLSDHKDKRLKINRQSQVLIRHIEAGQDEIFRDLKVSLGNDDLFEIASA